LSKWLRLLFAVMFLCGTYLQVDMIASRSIESIYWECIDSRTAPDGWIYVFELTNPTGRDVTFGLSIKMYVEDTFVTTLELAAKVPARQSVTAEAHGIIGHRAHDAIINNPNAVWRHEGQFWGRCLFITKRWSYSWTD